MKNKIFTFLLTGTFVLFSATGFSQSSESQTGAVPKSGNDVVKKVKVEKDDKERTIIKSNKKNIKEVKDKVVKDIKNEGENTLNSGENAVVKGKPIVEKEIKKQKEKITKEVSKEIVSKAKVKKETKVKELGLSVKKGNTKVTQAKDKIKLAKEKLSLDKNNLTEEAYNKQAQKIENAEVYIKKLEQKLTSATKVKQ